MDEVAMPWDALDEGVARLAADGRLLTCNRAMQGLIGRPVDGGVEASLAMFGMTPDELAAFGSGQAVACVRGDRHWRLRRVTSGVDTWLLATDVTELHRAEVATFAGARARTLATLVGAFVHDLNNHLNLTLALAGQLRGLVHDAEEGRILDELAVGTQLGAQLARSLAGMLSRDDGRRGKVLASAAVQDAIVAVTKACRGRGVALRTLRMAAGVHVRAGVADLGNLYLQCLLAVVEAEPRTVEIEFTTEESPVGGGRSRVFARLQARALGVAATSAARLLRVAHLQPGCLAELAATAGRLSGLAQAAMIAGRLGGDLRAQVVGGDLSLTCSVPAS